MRRCVIALALLLCAERVFTASDLAGQVTVGAVPVPGASVAATQGDRRLLTVTDPAGVFRFTGIADGAWSIRVDMIGFAPATAEVIVPITGAPPVVALKLLTLADITRDLPVGANTFGPPTNLPPPAFAPGATADKQQPAFRRADTTASGSSAVPALPASPAPDDAGDSGMGAADGLLVNGSVNNGAASPFAQLRAFGNNRPGQRSLYNGGVGFVGSTSAWDSRPYSFSTFDTGKPSYNNVHLMGNVGGPLRIPGLFGNGQVRPIFYLGVQRTADTNANTTSALLPDNRQRAGDFSQTLDALGRPVRVIDPRTGLPFAGGVIPADRISPQAAALLGYYPRANLDGDFGANYQIPVVSDTAVDSLQFRLQRPIRRDMLQGYFNYQRTKTTVGNLFDFQDTIRASGFETQVNWTHRFSQFLSFRARYQLTRLTNSTATHFANRTNVSGDAGIAGNNQDPANWGPPSLIFSSGLAGLSDGLPAFTRNTTNGGSYEMYWSRGRHYFTIGEETRRHGIDIRAQQDPRGSFAFTGAITGHDFADFLLGLPSTSAIATGNPDKFLRGWSHAAYVQDDWRVSPVLTINAGVRWDFESPMTERLNRLVNLDVSDDFRTAAPMLAGTSAASLMNADYLGIQPRLAVSWRPVPGSSLVVRGSYGSYRNTNVYQSLATQLAQQPPLSNTFSAETSAAAPLTLANGFIAPASTSLNTFAVDPDFKVGYAHNWQVGIQRDLPMSLTTNIAYFGTKGSHLIQQFLPNTFPRGAVNPCPACPAGFIYLTSDGSSSRHAGQFQLRRRLRNGFSAQVQYMLARAVDNASAFNTSNANLLSSASIAQNWLDLDAEQAPSSFDQRHQITAQVEYTTGVGVTGGALLSGWKGRLLRNWTFTGQLTTGSGTPLTPIVLVPQGRTGVTGTIRASLTGIPNDAPDGYYLNPASFTIPAPGTWGDAGRHSIIGPRQFNLNAGVTRTFPWGQRVNLEWRLDATNVLNRVTYSGISTIVGSPQFGLPTRANAMRKLTTTMRLRF